MLLEKQSARSLGRSPDIAQPRGRVGENALANSGAAIQPTEQRDAYSLREFAARHGISISHLFDLIRDGQGPRIMKVGRRSLISVEAAADWRREREVCRG